MKKLIIFLFVIFPFVVFGQRTIKGNVKSTEGPLAGVSVNSRNSNEVTVTDTQGNFQIIVAEKATGLRFTFVGYKTKEISIDQGQEYQVILEKDTKQLKEVAVRGFSGVIGQARRRLESVQSVPESVVTLTSQEIQTKGIVNVQTFANTVPNMNFTTSQGVGNI